MRLRRDAEQEKKASDDENAEEYELENEDSDKPRQERDASNYAADLQNDVKALNYDIK